MRACRLGSVALLGMLTGCVVAPPPQPPLVLPATSASTSAAPTYGIQAPVATSTRTISGQHVTVAAAPAVYPAYPYAAYPYYAPYPFYRPYPFYAGYYPYPFFPWFGFGYPYY